MTDSLLHRAIVVLHIAAAVVALGGGAAALRWPNGTAAHRRAGRAYVWAWVLFSATGIWIGRARPTISPFEILTILGAICVAFGVRAFRKTRSGAPAWRHDHLRWMIRSYAFVVVASINQIIVQGGLPNPPWLFWTLSLAPFVVLPPYVARLRGRFPVRTHENSSA